MLRVEFTIEPFVEGQPGPHVTSAIRAVEARGVHVEMGPFGTSCSVPADAVAEVVGALTAAAVANGATHVSVHMERTS
jgi:uncharacterized protein YqgV (UPF0045/DUF77 family)